MKKNRILLSISLICIFMYSCKKDKDNETNPPEPAPSYKNYGQLKVGNYWVYQLFEIDSSGAAAALPQFDSIYVEKDSSINGKTYYKIVKPKPYVANQHDIYFERDSLHFIVASNGRILFSSEDFSSIFFRQFITAGPGDTVFSIVQQMADKNQVAISPSGSYATMNFKEIYSFYPSWSSFGSNRYKHTRYAENIGIVIETLPFFASNPNSFERRLLRYHLN